MEQYDHTLLEQALRFETSCSGGPGGQHVNRTRSRVTACLSIPDCPAFTPDQRQRLLEKLASRLTQEGVLRISSEESRSQDDNKRIALQTLHEVLRKALTRPRKRVPTKRSRASQQKRMDEKSRRGSIKRERGRSGED